MTERLVRVSFRKQVSDGNYGTEAAEVALEWNVTDDELSTADVQAAEDMLKQAREIVQTELAASPNPNVRRLFQPRTTAAASAMSVPPEPEDEGDEVPPPWR